MISYEELSKVFDMDNPLTLEYFETCSKDTEEPKYFERHHILPKCIWKEYTNSVWNKVKLSYADHLRAHIILPDIMIIKKHRMQMLHPLQFMFHNPKYGEFDIPTFIRLKQARSDSISGENHPHFGKPRSEETKEKLRKTNSRPLSEHHRQAIKDAALKGENHPMWGRRGPLSPMYKMPRTKEWLENQSKARKGEVKSETARENFCKYSYECYDLEGNFIKLYRTVRDLVAVGFTDSGKISDVCNGKRKSHRGFIWKKIIKVPL